MHITFRFYFYFSNIKPTTFRIVFIITIISIFFYKEIPREKGY